MFNIVILAIIAQGIWHAKKSSAADDIVDSTENATEKTEAKKHGYCHSSLDLLPAYCHKAPTNHHGGLTQCM